MADRRDAAQEISDRAPPESRLQRNLAVERYLLGVYNMNLLCPILRIAIGAYVMVVQVWDRDQIRDGRVH